MGHKLYLLRRGFSRADTEPRTTGDLDFLTRLGETQANLVGLFFATEGVKFTTVFVSPQCNARHTASAVANQQQNYPEIRVVPQFAELADWSKHVNVQEAFKSVVLPELYMGDVLVVAHYYVLRAIFNSLASKENIDCCYSKNIGHCTPFVWDPESPGRVTSIDPNVHYSK